MFTPVDNVSEYLYLNSKDVFYYLVKNISLFFPFPQIFQIRETASNSFWLFIILETPDVLTPSVAPGFFIVIHVKLDKCYKSITFSGIDAYYDKFKQSYNARVSIQFSGVYMLSYNSREVARKANDSLVSDSLWHLKQSQ